MGLTPRPECPYSIGAAETASRSTAARAAVPIRSLADVVRESEPRPGPEEVCDEKNTYSSGFTAGEIHDAPVTLLHALRDVGREAPALRWLTRPWALAILRDMLRHVDRYRDNPHALAKLRRLFMELDAAAHLPDSAASSLPTVDTGVFQETDSFLGTANFLRSELVGQWHNGDRIDRAMVERLLSLSLAIGDAPGVAKAGLLARAVGAPR